MDQGGYKEMPKERKIMLGVNDLFKLIHDNKKLIFVSESIEFLQFVPKKNDDKLCFLIPSEYWETSNGKNIYDYLHSQRNLVSHILTANYGNSGAKTARNDLAKDITANFDLLKITNLRFQDYFKETLILDSFIPDVIPTVNSFLIGYSNDSKIDLVKKSLRNMAANRKYGDFFWWLFMFALFQEDITEFVDYLPDTQYQYVITKLLPQIASQSNQFEYSQMMEISETAFWPLRKELIKSAEGHLIVAGSSLMNAFDIYKEETIINVLRESVSAGNLSRVSIILTDPILFDAYWNCGYPIRDIDGAISGIEENLYDFFELNGINLSIYFVPLLHIDHAVITEEFMAFRSTKLWTSDRKYKGAFCLYLGDQYVSGFSEYKAHKDYLQTIMRNCTRIYPADDVDEDALSTNTARGKHMRWRKKLRDKKYKHIQCFKLYEKQLFHYVCDSWSADKSLAGQFFASSSILKYEDLFNYDNLLSGQNDESQKVLLPYLQVTNHLFQQVVKKHDQSENSYSRIFPSLDLGFPNNVQRLAGGFATGMLVTWNCGIDIVPIDATVNVCTSSVFKLSAFNPVDLDQPNVMKKKLKELFHNASEQKGYSFSFTSGNHFLMIAKEQGSEGHDDYYLVLHSSANELKNSYLGLYPVEGNWYASKIKTLHTDSGDRYIRYLKDEDARHFITMAHQFEHYNEQIHLWLAQKLNNDTPFEVSQIWMKHHYYMPTDSSIAIGTFAEPVGEEVPLFSAPDKPVYIFKIGEDNWQVNLGANKGKVCLVPHGWGQEIEHIESITIEENELVLDVNGKKYKTTIASQNHIECPGKKLRQFKDGQEFLRIGSKMVNGKITHTLIPVFEYSKRTEK